MWTRERWSSFYVTSDERDEDTRMGIDVADWTARLVSITCDCHRRVSQVDPTYSSLSP